MTIPIFTAIVKVSFEKAAPKKQELLAKFFEWMFNKLSHTIRQIILHWLVFKIWLGLTFKDWLGLFLLLRTVAFQWSAGDECTFTLLSQWIDNSLALRGDHYRLP